MSRDTVLVSAEWAEKHLDTPGVVFVEVDEDTTAYDGGHIPGAIARLEVGPAGSGPARLRRPGAVRPAAVGAGHRQRRHRVLYGGNNNWFAAYAYWYFKLYGHRDVRLIDGGRKKWELDASPVPTDVAAAPATPYTATEPDLSIRAFRDEVVQPRSATKNLVDVRSPDEYAGRLLAPAHLPQEQSQRGGHIPTASTCRGARRPTTTARSSPTTSSPSSTATPALDGARTPSRTAGSVSAPRTPGSCSRSCSASRM